MSCQSHKSLTRMALAACLAGIAAAAAAAQPPNDDFDNAIVVGTLPFSDFQEASEATLAPDDPPSTCGLYSQYTMWYSFTPVSDVEVDGAASYVSSVHVYTGSRSALTQVACGGFQASVRFEASAGTTYHILVGTAATPPALAPVTFTLPELPPPPPPPANDDFDDTIVVGALPFADTQDAVGATSAPDDPASSCGWVPSHTIWYSFTPAANALVDASANYVSSVHVYTGSRGALTQVACGGFQSPVRFQAGASTTYYILVAVGATPPTPALVTFTLQEVPPPPPPPANDDIASATVIAALPFSESTNTVSATTEPGEPWCYGSAATIWYSYTPAADVRVEVNTSGTWPMLPAVAVFTGSPGSLATLGCESSNFPFGARVRFDAAAGTTYWIMVGSAWGNSGGPVAVSVAEAPPAFSLDTWVDPRGAVVPTSGTATVTGTVVCSQPSYVMVSGSLRQQRAGQELLGWFSTGTMCDGSATWSATPSYTLGLFRGRSALLYTGGPAEAGVTVSGWGWTTGEWDSATVVAPVRLTGAK